MTFVSPRVVTPCLETLMGHYLDYLNPQPDQIDLTDIARGLAHTCRYAGQTTRYYSVAEHAVYVRQLVIEAGHPELALAALHHDSHEAYLGDWPSPLKKAIGIRVFEELAEDLDRAIGEALGLDASLFHHDVVKKADYQALLSEAATLKPSRGVGLHWNNTIVHTPVPGAGLPPEYAERLFVEAHQA
jgi:hypothetical protein